MTGLATVRVANCIACLFPDGMHIRFDKKSRPFAKCQACSCTLFMPSLQALCGLLLLSSKLDYEFEKCENPLAWRAAAIQQWTPAALEICSGVSVKEVAQHERVGSSIASN